MTVRHINKLRKKRLKIRNCLEYILIHPELLNALTNNFYSRVECLTCFTGFSQVQEHSVADASVEQTEKEAKMEQSEGKIKNMSSWPENMV